MTIDIALIAAEQQCEKITTLIKSVCFHQTDVKFHIIHADIPSTWFDELNQKLSILNCQALSVVINNQIFEQYLPFNESVGLYAYLKLSIPQLIDAERILFLSNECIVNSSLQTLWSLDLSDFALAATPDLFLDHLAVSHHRFPDLKPYFNAGVLLFNTTLCNNSPFYPQMYKALQEQQNLSFAEQDILNLICVGRWYPLTKLYNFQAGTRYLFKQHQADDLAEQAMDVMGHTPKIIQFNQIAPLNDLNESVPYEELYLFYVDLEWEEIEQKYYWKSND